MAIQQTSCIDSQVSIVMQRRPSAAGAYLLKPVAFLPFHSIDVFILLQAHSRRVIDAMHECIERTLVLEAIRRVAAAVGLPGFPYYVIPPAVPDPAFEVTDPPLPALVLGALMAKGAETAVAVVAPPEPPRVGLSIVGSVKKFVLPVAPSQFAPPFSLLVDVATAVASMRPAQAPTAQDGVACEALNARPQGAQPSRRATFAVVGRR